MGLFLQKQSGSWNPYSLEDKNEGVNYKENQVVEFKPIKIGAKKMRSVVQMRLYRGLIRTMYYHLVIFMNEVEMNEWIKLKLGYIESVIYVDGVQHMKTGSLAFDSMDHAEFCAFVDKAIPFIAGLIGITEDELLNNYDK